MKKALVGRIAVITGGGRGIGQAIAERFAHEGADIAVADIGDAGETEALVRAAGARFCSGRLDVSQPDSVQEFARQVRLELGRADIVVNNAGIMGKISFDDLSFEDWKRFQQINLDSQFLMAKAFLEDLKQSSAGRIINMASNSVWTTLPQSVHYITTKAAILGFTSSLATELGPFGIAVNAIAPSLVRTPGRSEFAGAEADYAMVAARQVLRRVQTPVDITGAATFLASEDGGFITGQTIAVDGGLTRR